MSNSRRTSGKKKSRSVPASPAKAAETGNGLLDHYLVLILFLALISLTLLSAETPLLVGLLGLALCVAGFAQGPVKIDLWVLIPLVLYQVFSIVSSYMVYRTIYGTMSTGFASTQGIYPVLYLLMAYLDHHQQLLLRRLCTLWAGLVAAAGLLYFVTRALDGRAARLGFLFGNPNTLGIFLVISWFVLQTCELTQHDGASDRFAWMTHLEPLLLTALALTLSMGSFVAMAAGILFLIVSEFRCKPRPDVMLLMFSLLARASFCFGLGILMYIAARRTAVPWLCIPLLLYVLAVCVLWNRFLSFLGDFPAATVAAAALGVLVAIAAVIIRPSAVDTFAERLAMMKNGLGYLTKRPLYGLGPYQWRIWNLYDSDIYYSTHHIHNSLIHIGVEQGLVAMAMAVVVIVRCFWKRYPHDRAAGFVAFVVHNMIDPSFFSLGITSMSMMTVAEPGTRGKQLPGIVVKLFFAAFAVMFAGILLDWAGRL